MQTFGTRTSPTPDPRAEAVLVGFQLDHGPPPLHRGERFFERVKLAEQSRACQRRLVVRPQAIAKDSIT